MADRVGQHFGNYRLIRLIGEGGFAEVYLGEHLHLGTQAAIKVLYTQLLTDDTEHFRREARVIAHLEHPNIVRVLDFGVENKTPFLVMSYAPYGNLRQRHPRGESLPLATILPYVRQIADALQYAHNARIIHRDVKPENMLIGRRQEVLLSDFGIAFIAQSSRPRTVSLHQPSKDVLGTVSYMAPEQIEGKPQPASDQYALAIVVYEWLCGRCPFEGSFTEVAVQHMVTPPPPLREKMPTISPAIESVVLTALSKKPQKRFTNIAEFASALEQASSTAHFSPGQFKQSHAMIALPERALTSPAIPPGVDHEAQAIYLAAAPSSAPAAAAPATTPTRQRRRRLSRRTLVASLAGVMAVGITGSGGAMLLRSQGHGLQDFILPARLNATTPGGSVISQAAATATNTPGQYGSTPAGQQSPLAHATHTPRGLHGTHGTHTPTKAPSPTPYSTPTAGAGTTPTATATAPAEPITTPIIPTSVPNLLSTAALFRLYNSTTHDYFYTTDQTEANKAASQGYTSQGIACYVYAVYQNQPPPPNTVALYRLYNPTRQAHFYTTNKAEADKAVANSGYTSEGFACYVYTTAVSNTVALYRLYNSTTQDHFYTTSQAEANTAVSQNGYTAEGVACYVYLGQR